MGDPSAEQIAAWSGGTAYDPDSGWWQAIGLYGPWNGLAAQGAAPETPLETRRTASPAVSGASEGQGARDGGRKAQNGADEENAA